MRRSSPLGNRAHHRAARPPSGNGGRADLSLRRSTTRAPRRLSRGRPSLPLLRRQGLTFRDPSEGHDPSISFPPAACARRSRLSSAARPARARPWPRRPMAGSRYARAPRAFEARLAALIKAIGRLRVAQILSQRSSASGCAPVCHRCAGGLPARMRLAKPLRGFAYVGAGFKPALRCAGARSTLAGHDFV